MFLHAVRISVLRRLEVPQSVLSATGVHRGADGTSGGIRLGATSPVKW